MYSYIKQMQYEASIEETIKIISNILNTKDYDSIKELRKVLGSSFIDHCLKEINQRMEKLV